MENLISKAVEGLDMENYYLYRPNERSECIVYSYTYRGKVYADNQCKTKEYTILLNCYVSVDKDISFERDRIIKAMQKGGFKLQPVPTPNKEGDFINIALMFKKII